MARLDEPLRSPSGAATTPVLFAYGGWQNIGFSAARCVTRSAQFAARTDLGVLGRLHLCPR
mgnify:CR=1 FL=1